jgi:hypothetical protein
MFLEKIDVVKFRKTVLIRISAKGYEDCEKYKDCLDEQHIFSNEYSSKGNQTYR